MSNNLKGIIKLSQSRYEELLKNKSIVVDGVTINYDPLVLYDVETPKVTINTQQTIVGEKNFTGGIKKNNINVATINDIPPVVDTLTSNASTSSLSANQGRVLNEKISNMVSTLNGFSCSFTFDNLSDVISAFGLTIDVSNPADVYNVGKNTITYNNATKTLKNGDVFYIIDTNVPDYWFSADDKKLYKMETGKIDLSGYVKNETLNLYLPLAGGTITGNINLAHSKRIQDANGDNLLVCYTDYHYTYINETTNSLVFQGSQTRPDYVNTTGTTQLALLSDIPKIATSSTPGLTKTQSSYGINLNVSDGTLSVAAATDAEIEAKTNTYKPIVPSNLEKAVTTIGDSRYGRISVVDNVIVID